MSEYSVCFTPRENEVYIELLKGKTTPEIAEDLIVEQCTVATYVVSILQKKMCNSRRELLANRIKELEDTIRDMRR